MYLNATSCCALQDIAGLKEHPTPEEAMQAFCENTIVRSDYDWNTGRYTKRGISRAKLHGHYIFTGVVGYKGNREGGSVTYGPKFAAFIRKHQLGAVVAGKAEINRTNHPTHIVKVWVWTPNQVKVKAWYRKYLKEHPNGQ